MTACCNALAALLAANLAVEDLICIYAPRGGPVPPSLSSTPEFKLVLKLARSRLLDMFGDVPSVIASPMLTEQLLRLPRAGFIAVLSSEQLRTDCEDNVFMMTSWWLQSEAEAGRVNTAKELAELKEMIHYRWLSSTYMAQAFKLAPCMRPTSLQLSELVFSGSFSPDQCVYYSTHLIVHCPAAWFRPQRPPSTSRIHNTVLLTLCISSAQLSQHLNAIKIFEEGGQAPELVSAPVDFRGLSFSLVMASCKQNPTSVSKCFVYLQVSARLPSCSSMVDLQFDFPCSHKISIHSNVPGSPLYPLKMPSHFLRRCMGWADFAKTASKLPGDSSTLSWWDSFIIDGQIRLVAELCDGRTNVPL